MWRQQNNSVKSAILNRLSVYLVGLTYLLVIPAIYLGIYRFRWNHDRSLQGTCHQKLWFFLFHRIWTAVICHHLINSRTHEGGEKETKEEEHRHHWLQPCGLAARGHCHDYVSDTVGMSLYSYVAGWSSYFLRVLFAESSWVNQQQLSSCVTQYVTMSLHTVHCTFICIQLKTDNFGLEMTMRVFVIFHRSD